MSKGISALMEFFHEDNKIFKTNKQEIAGTNLDTIQKISPVFLTVIVIYFFIMHVMLHEEKLDLIYYIFIPLFVLSYVFSILAKYHKRKQNEQTNNEIERDRFCVWFFVVTVMMFITVISIFPYFQKPAIYFAPMLICCSIAVYETFGYSISFAAFFLVAFNVTVSFFKTGEMLSYDRYSSMMGFIGCILLGFIIFRTRDAEYKAKEEMEKFVNIDSLTGQLNKPSIERFCKDSIENNKGKDSTLLMIDIDSFKQINDQLGHKEGDHVLAKVGHLFGDFFSDNGTVGRFGGDEFLVFLKGIADATKVRDHLEGLLLTLSGYFPEYSSMKISCSIGIATNEGNKIPFSMALYRADMALYEAKNQGRNCSCAYLEVVDEENADKPMMLIADDAEVSRAILSNIFKNDYAIIQAKSGKEAYEAMIKYHRVLSIVLLDWNMPEMSGKEVLGLAQHDEKLKNIPVVIITGDESIELEALQAGAIDYITKPFDGNVIRLRVHNSIRTIS